MTRQTILSLLLVIFSLLVPALVVLTGARSLAAQVGDSWVANMIAPLRTLLLTLLAVDLAFLLPLLGSLMVEQLRRCSSTAQSGPPGAQSDPLTAHDPTRDAARDPSRD